MIHYEADVHGVCVCTRGTVCGSGGVEKSILSMLAQVVLKIIVWDEVELRLTMEAL